MTPYYEHGGITIYHGDCRDVLPGVEVDVVVTDPPYGFNAYPTDEAPPTSVVRGLLQHETAAIFGYPEGLVAFCVDAQVVPDEWVTWWATNNTQGRHHARLPRESEHVAIFGPTPGAAEITRNRVQDASTLRIHASRGNSAAEARDGDVWCYPSPGRGFNSHLRRHPNEKPLKLMERLVVLCSMGCQCVLDPYMGSGTTLVAAKELGRKAIGIEIEERYCEIAAQRLSQEVLPLG